MPRFSKHYSSFQIWLNKANKSSNYTKRIVRLHKINPKVSLSILRNLKVSDLYLSKKKWVRLKPEEKVKRKLALEVLRNLRLGNTLSDILQRIDLTRNEIFQYLGKYIFRKSGKWKATKYDSIERSMQIYEKGKMKVIIVKGSKISSQIGEYFNAVKEYIHSGNPQYLKRLKVKSIIDSNGKRHYLETNPQKVRDIEDSKENPELFEVYSDE